MLETGEEQRREDRFTEMLDVEKKKKQFSACCVQNVFLRLCITPAKYIYMQIC